MKPTVLLFDIDGTLITTGGAGRRAMTRALADLGAVGAGDFSYAGMTDRLIVRRSLEEAAVAATEARIDAVIARYLERLGEEVAQSVAADYRVHPGMREAVAEALAREGFAVGLGTGNVERGARIKLSRVGLADAFAFGGFGCDAEDRGELIRIGAERGAARLGVARAACRVVVIGDTERDVAAARAIGAEAFAVATGTIGREALAASAPDHLFDTLAEPDARRALWGAH